MPRPKEAVPAAGARSPELVTGDGLLDFLADGLGHPTIEAGEFTIDDVMRRFDLSLSGASGRMRDMVLKGKVTERMVLDPVSRRWKKAFRQAKK